MELGTIVLLIILIAVCCWIIREFVANPKIAKLLYGVLILFIVLWVLQSLGVIPAWVSVRGR